MNDFKIYNHSVPIPFGQVYDEIQSNMVVILDVGRVEGRDLENKIHQEIKNRHSIEVTILAEYIATTADSPLYIIKSEHFNLSLSESIKAVFLRYDAAGRPNAYLDQE